MLGSKSFSRLRRPVVTSSNKRFERCHAVRAAAAVEASVAAKVPAVAAV
jgi:hypothetical protein